MSGLGYSVNFTLSTGGRLEALWGLNFDIIVGLQNNDQIEIFKSSKCVVNDIMELLKVKVIDFPILKERLGELNLHFHGSSEEWNEALLNYAFNKETIYLCDHC